MLNGDLINLSSSRLKSAIDKLSRSKYCFSVPKHGMIICMEYVMRVIGEPYYFITNLNFGNFFSWLYPARTKSLELFLECHLS